MTWNFDNDRPIYAQIIEHMKRFIVSGQLSPGDKVAPVRELAAQAGVNPNTMQRALSELERLGLVYTNRTSGRFITEDEDMIATIKKELARQTICAFLEQMASLGYDRDGALTLVKQLEQEDQNHE
jgi:GntR family transcriptional regulator